MSLAERFKIEFSTFGIVMIPLCIGINIAAGYIGQFTPFWLDTLGTMLAAVILGPFNALVVGLLTNIFKFLVFDPYALPYAIVNGAIGFVTGLFAWKTDFFRPEKTGMQIVKVLILGVILALTATFTSAPLNYYFWGGYTGKAFADAIFVGLLASDYDPFTASLIAEFISDILDKPVCIIIVWLVLINIPERFIFTKQ